MADGPAPDQPCCVTSSTRTATRSRRRLAPVLDLEALRVRSEGLVSALAAAPVRHVPAELLEALLGSWGTAEELGLAPQRHLRLVAG